MRSPSCRCSCFAHDSLKALVFSLGLAFLIGLVIEGCRRIAARRGAKAVAAKATAG
jgi:membrane-associated protein